MLPGKVENSTFSTQICLEMDLGLKFEKTNVEIRISILQVLCVCVCQFSGKTNSFDFFSPNLPKKGFRVGNSAN